MINTSKNKNKQIAVIDLPIVMFEITILGYTLACKLFLEYNLNPFKKCAASGQNLRECRKCDISIECGENHTSNEYTNNEVVKCANCIYCNQNVDHIITYVS